MYFVSIHYFAGANQTSKHKERAFTVCLDAYNKWHAEQAAIAMVKQAGAKRIVQAQSTVM